MKITDFKITYWEGKAERSIGDANGPYGRNSTDSNTQQTLPTKRIV